MADRYDEKARDLMWRCDGGGPRPLSTYQDRAEFVVVIAAALRQAAHEHDPPVSQING